MKLKMREDLYLHKRRCLPVLSVVAALTLSASVTINMPTAQAQSQALTDALTSAYLNNPTLLLRRARLRSTDEEVPQALSNWRPDVSMTIDGGYSDVHNTNSSGSGRNQHRNSYGYSLDVTQPLFRGGQTLAATSEAENNVRAERGRLLGVEQTILLQTISAYMDVFRDEAVLKLNINNEQVLARQLEATRDRFEVGEITRTDVHQAEARRAQAKADRIQSEGDLEASRAGYLNVVGEPAPGGLAVPDLPEGLPDSKEEALKIAAVKNPSVIAAEFSRLAARDNIDEVWGQLLPEVDLTAGYSMAAEGSAEQGHIDTASVELSVTIPIYQQGAVYSSLRKARQDAAESAFTVDEQRRVAVETAAKAWEALQTASARVISFQAQIEANVVALEGVQSEASVGSRTVLDVLDAEQELLDSRVAHVRARRDELVALYEVKSALGQMTARDLGLPVTLYDPRDHYREVRGKWAGGKSSGDNQ
jgi:outer membrane protein